MDFRPDNQAAEVDRLLAVGAHRWTLVRGSRPQLCSPIRRATSFACLHLEEVSAPNSWKASSRSSVTGHRSPGATWLIMTDALPRCHHDKRWIWRVSWLRSRC
jgi:hypothetical protein